MVKEIIRTNSFLRKLDKSILEKVEKLIIKLLYSPETGKPMRHDRKGTREVYVPPFRMSYRYDKPRDILIFLDIYHKDNQ
ncbi:type II toxin-antitoxin system RelE/ParE family toxin [Candidatus Pacearchaeota archaeon]|nr:type II toxin-antitoxin system RelE/ParE family toxin [Candidatus Pacearchaeota archaeon]